MLLKLIIDYKGDLDKFSELLQRVHYESTDSGYIFCSEDGCRLIATQNTAVDFANFAEEYECEVIDVLEVSKEDIEIAEKEMDDPERVYSFITSCFYKGDLDGDLSYIFDKLGFEFDSWDQSGLNATEIFALCGESLENRE